MFYCQCEILGERFVESHSTVLSLAQSGPRSIHLIGRGVVSNFASDVFRKSQYRLCARTRATLRRMFSSTPQPRHHRGTSQTPTRPSAHAVRRCPGSLFNNEQTIVVPDRGFLVINTLRMRDYNPSRANYAIALADPKTVVVEMFSYPIQIAMDMVQRLESR
jgi:hypothetical protein